MSDDSGRYVSGEFYLGGVMTGYRYYPAKLYPSQIAEACCIFERIQGRLPKQICYPFVIYKILEKIIPKGPQLIILKYIETKIPASTHLKHEQTWNN